MDSPLLNVFNTFQYGTLVNITAFALWPKYGFTFFQPLALWNLVWVLLGYYHAAKKPNKNWLINHYYFISYAYVGVLAAALARIPLSFGFLPNEAAFISIAVVFGISIYLIEKQSKKLMSVLSGKDHHEKNYIIKPPVIY